MHIHFVCLGNVYRSRFAESYAKSKHTEHTFTSSGLLADQNHYGPISWWGSRLAFNAGVATYLAHSWTQSTQELLEGADLVVFMHPNVKKRASSMFDISVMTSHTWEVNDLLPSSIDIETEVKTMHESDETAQLIMHNVDELLDAI